MSTWASASGVKTVAVANAVTSKFVPSGSLGLMAHSNSLATALERATRTSQASSLPYFTAKGYYAGGAVIWRAGSFLGAMLRKRPSLRAK